jgi:hypothetical protein
MAITDILGFGREDDKGVFDQNEAADLDFHVRQCTKRYNALNLKLSRLLWVGYAIIALHLLGVQGATNAFWRFFATMP